MVPKAPLGPAMSANPVGTPGEATAGISPSPEITRRRPTSATCHTPCGPSCTVKPGPSDPSGGTPPGGNGTSVVEYQRPCADATQHHRPLLGKAMKISCQGAPGAPARSSCTRPSTTNGSAPQRPV